MNANHVHKRRVLGGPLVCECGHRIGDPSRVCSREDAWKQVTERIQHDKEVRERGPMARKEGDQ